MLTEILTFASDHPFLAWCALWLLWIIVPVIYVISTIILAPFNFVLKLNARAERTKRIVAHGWPTQALMDADGEIVHPKPPEVKN